MSLLQSLPRRPGRPLSATPSADPWAFRHPVTRILAFSEDFAGRAGPLFLSLSSPPYMVRVQGNEHKKSPNQEPLIGP
jgi:hypothetical protein